MKKNRITLLLLLSILLMVGVHRFLLEANQLKQDQKIAPTNCNISININTTLDMIDESLQEQLNCFSKVVAIVNRKKRHNLLGPFKDKVKAKITHWLLKASEIEKDDCFKNYLKRLSKNILEKSHFFVDLPRWTDLKENRAEIIFPKDDRYMSWMLMVNNLFYSSLEGLIREENSVIDTMIYLNLPEDTRKFEEYTALFAKMQGHLPPWSKQEMSYSPLAPAFKISHLVSSPQPIGFTLVYPDTIDHPESGKSGEEKSFKIIVFKNVIKAYFEEVLTPISGHVLSEERLWDLDYDSYISNIIMRRISHNLGPVFLLKVEGEEEAYEDEKFSGENRVKKRKPKEKKKRKEVKELKTIREILKDLFPILEAVKSQMIALHNTSVLIKNGLISEDKDINIYSTYLVSLIDRLRNKAGGMEVNKVSASSWDTFLRKNKSENFLSALFQFNFLVQQEGILFNINSRKLDIDRLKFEKAVEKLTGDVLRVMGNATYSTAKKFIGMHIRSAPQLQEILERLETIPLNVEFHLERKDVD